MSWYLQCGLYMSCMLQQRSVQVWSLLNMLESAHPSGGRTGVLKPDFDLSRLDCLTFGTLQLMLQGPHVFEQPRSSSPPRLPQWSPSSHLWLL